MYESFLHFMKLNFLYFYLFLSPFILACKPFVVRMLCIAYFDKMLTDVEEGYHNLILLTTMNNK